VSYIIDRTRRNKGARTEQSLLAKPLKFNSPQQPLKPNAMQDHGSQPGTLEGAGARPQARHEGTPGMQEETGNLYSQTLNPLPPSLPLWRCGRLAVEPPFALSARLEGLGFRVEGLGFRVLFLTYWACHH
jgi:hypothetical protein